MIKDGLRLNVLDFKTEVNMDVYILHFPESILNAVLDIKKSLTNKRSEKYKNLSLSRLNTVIEGLLPSCLSNYVNSYNLNDGWIFSTTSENLDEIKHYLTFWAVDCGVEESFVNDVLRTLEYKKTTIIVSPEDLMKDKLKKDSNGINGYLKRRLLLFHIGAVISSNVTYDMPISNNGVNSIKFNRVCSMVNKSTLRLMSEPITDSFVITSKKTKEKTTCYNSYSYYIDLSVEEIYAEDYPKLLINMGLVRFKTIPKSFSLRRGKKIHPYIQMNKSTHGESRCDNFIKGIIYPSSNKWDKLFEESFLYSYNMLPDVKDIFLNPQEYIQSEELKILIPYGTHYKNTSISVSQGADLFVRAEFAELVRSTLASNLPGVFSGDFNYAEKRDKRNNKNSHSTVKGISIKDGVFKLELYYISDVFKSEFQKVITTLNRGEFVLPPVKVDTSNMSDSEKSTLKKENKAAKKLNDPILSTAGSIIKTLFPDLYTNAVKNRLSIVTLPCIFEVKYINILTDLKLNIQIPDEYTKQKRKNISVGENKSNDEEEDKKLIATMNREIAKLNRAFNRIKESPSAIATVVEFPGASFFSDGCLIDLKNCFRHNLAKKGRCTQFIEAKDLSLGDSASSDLFNRIEKCLLESLRMSGLSIVEIDTMLKANSFSDNTALVGLYLLPGTEKFLLTAHVNGNLLSFVVGLSKKWVSYSDGLLLAGSNIDYISKVPTDALESALKRLIEQVGLDHLVLIVNRTSIKSKVPYFDNMTQAFNLSIRYSGDKDFKLTEMDAHISSKISVVTIDEEAGGLCPEWVAVIGGVENCVSMPNSFYKYNEDVYYGLAPKASTSKMPSLAKCRKEERLKGLFRKETAITYTSPHKREGYSAEFLCRLAHSLRGNASYQYTFTDCTVFPYPLHLAHKMKEYVFKNTDLIFGGTVGEEMESEPLDAILIEAYNIDSITKNGCNITDTLKEIMF